MIRLNLGCCDLPLKGWINIDKSTSPHIKSDLTADILKLEEHFQPNSVDEIYFGHGIEHLYPKDIDGAIEHWKSLLKPGGKLALMTPNFRFLAEQYLQGSIDMERLNNEFLYSYVQEDWHRSMHDQTSLIQLLARHGFKNIRPLDPMGDERAAYKDSTQCGVEGEK